ncbi:hypothetical protein NBH00_13160 [Paraconexibacter antarcticus]|uniref:Phage protein n=1 Tax=Paraconexibacter antarcticus TaxID=2949664 RepID=A0ABY5DN98_9ACTN|nr:hypothetical protein [Paraconexibacter antarcticus]UTI62311.1 hypothetical protein NBH00_13160 [Paraconexibacter antarcticus]
MNRRTSLSIAQARADLLAEWIGRRPETVHTVGDISRMPEVAYWHPAILELAVDMLVADGRLTEAADGVLCVKPRAEG